MFNSYVSQIMQLHSSNLVEVMYKMHVCVCEITKIFSVEIYVMLRILKSRLLLQDNCPTPIESCKRSLQGYFHSTSQQEHFRSTRIIAEVMIAESKNQTNILDHDLLAPQSLKGETQQPRPQEQEPRTKNP